MDIAFLYQSQRFLWDIDKSSTNLVKHGISFEEAVRCSSTRSFVLKTPLQVTNSAMLSSG